MADRRKRTDQRIDQTNQPVFYFGYLIREACEGGKSVSQLTKEINAANENAGTRCLVNRKLLAKLKENSPKVGLTLDTCQALDTYFRFIGKIAHEPPLFAHPALIATLVRVPRVHFLYAAKPRPKERRVDVSCWDLDAGAHILTAASRACAGGEFKNAHVLWRHAASLRTSQAEPWYQVLDADQDSVVSIGSPLASLSTEVMLARMFGVEPFRTPQVEPPGRPVPADGNRPWPFWVPDARTGNRVPLPFWYCWAAKMARDFHSAFALTPAELRACAPDTAARVKASQSHAFGLNGRIHEVSRNGAQWEMHGIVAAQRRAEGNLWLVISGLAGPATCAAAKLVPKIQDILPWEDGRISQVLWVPVLAHVKEGLAARSLGDIRELEGEMLVGQPRLYPRLGH